jgi:hypothetical protein
MNGLFCVSEAMTCYVVEDSISGVMLEMRRNFF